MHVLDEILTFDVILKEKHAINKKNSKNSIGTWTTLF